MAVAIPEIFDFCVIGCGPGGFAAAVSALDTGKHVCIIEGGEIGGTGVMWGALTSKTMWELAKDYAIAANIDRGYRSSGLFVDYQAVRTFVGTSRFATAEQYWRHAGRGQRQQAAAEGSDGDQ